MMHAKYSAQPPVRSMNFPLLHPFLSRSGIDLAIQTVFTSVMKLVFLLVGSLGLFSMGCFWRRSRNADAPIQPATAQSYSSLQPNSGSTPQVVVTAENANIGKVVRVNTVARFVVLNFPPGHLPVVDQSLMVYRQGLKVGELKVTGPIQDENIVADITAGDSEVGDEVRDR